MALTYEQFKQLRQSGLSADQIVQQEKSGTLKIPTLLTQPNQTADTSKTFHQQQMEQATGAITKTGEFLGMGEFGKGIGMTLAQPYVSKLQEGQSQQQNELFQNLQARIKEARQQGDSERVQRLVEAGKKAGFDLSAISEFAEEAPTTGQVIGSAALTGLGMLAGGTLGSGKVATVGGKAIGGALTKAGMKTLPTLTQTLSKATELAGTALKGSRTLRVAYGSGLGGLYGFFSGLEGGKTGKELTESFGIGVAAGTILSLGGEAIGSLFKNLKKTPSKATARGVGIKSKDVEKSFYYGTENIADKIAKEGYKGSASKIMDTARNNLSKYGQQIDNTLVKYSERTINKNQVINKVTNILDDPFLTENQKNGIQKIFDIIPDNMTPQEANKFKIKFAKSVPDRYWKTVDPNTTFKGDFYKNLSNAFRTTVEETLPENTIKLLNDKWGIAKSVLESLAGKGAKEFTQNSGYYGVGVVINKIVQSTLASTRWRTVGIAGGAKLTNKIVEQLSKLNPIEKNLLLRFITKDTSEQKPIVAPANTGY